MPEEIYLDDEDILALEQVAIDMVALRKKNPEACGHGFRETPEEHQRYIADREERAKNKPQPDLPGPAEPEEDSDKKSAEQYLRRACIAEQSGDHASARIYRRQARDYHGG